MSDMPGVVAADEPMFSELAYWLLALCGLFERYRESGVNLQPADVAVLMREIRLAVDEAERCRGHYEWLARRVAQLQERLNVLTPRGFAVIDGGRPGGSPVGSPGGRP